MAIAHRATGTAALASGALTPIIPAAQLTGDMMLLLAGGKPYNAGVSVATSGWNALSTFTDGTTAAGIDVGSMQVRAWYKEALSDTETDPAISNGSPAINVFGGIVIVFS